MADNQGQTIAAPVNHPPLTFEPQEQLGPVPAPASGGFRQRLRTPVVAAVIGGLLLLGVGFASGYVVGHDRGASSVSSTSTDGQTGFPGGRGGFGGQMPGGQAGQGSGQGTGTSPFGTGTTQDGTDLSQTQ